MRKIFVLFFDWYKKNYKLNLYITAGLFIWQLVHLYWMLMDIIGFRIFGYELWNVGKLGNLIISIVDYTEIPALILGSLFYIHEIQKEFKWKSVIFLIFLNSQWLHLFWITDEVVIAQFTGTALIVLPVWLSWFAILIDYLELPVIYDTIKKVISINKKTTTLSSAG